MENSSYGAVWGFLQALAIGFLIGAERESRGGAPEREVVPGLRDFMLIALLGSMAGYAGSIPIVVLAMSGVLALLVVKRLKDPTHRGITSDLAALATFWLGYMTQQPEMSGLALGGAVVLAIILMVKAPITHFVIDVVSREEVYDTIKFLTIIFIVYPLLPSGSYGPYGFFTPRTIWKFVILVSSVSYVGYFLTRFLSKSRGLILTSIFGGLVSTTASTTAFANAARESKANARDYAWASVLSNVVQFPRVALWVYAMNPALASAVSVPLMTMAGAGTAYALWLSRGGRGEKSGGHGPGERERARSIYRNPFALRPALQFGLAFTAITYLAKWGAARFGDRGVVVSSALGGLIDVDAISISIAELVKDGKAGMESGAIALLVALFANAAFKTGVSFAGGTPAFGRAMSLGFALMLGTGLAVAFAYL